MVSFALHVLVPCTCCGDGKEALDTSDSKLTCEEALGSVSQALGSHDDTPIFAITASCVAMSFDRQHAMTSSSQVPLLGIYVPPSLFTSFEYRKAGSPSHCEAVWMIHEEQESAIREEMSSKLLSSIHPFLTEHGKLVGIISARHDELGESAPADVVLIDVSNAPHHWLHDIKASLNGEPMATVPSAVIQLIPITTLSLSATEPSSLSLLCKSASEIPACPVCLHRIDPSRLGMPKPQNHQLCSKFCPGRVELGQQGDACRNQQFLRPWSRPSNCIACHVILDRWKHYLTAATLSNQDANESTDEKDDLFCHQCAMQETLWVCLTCGFVGCGRYSQRHAAQHFEETAHPYSLELATLRIWDYTSGEFVHRGDLLECPSVQRLDGQHSAADAEKGGADRETTDSDGNTYEENVLQRSLLSHDSCSFDEASPKKANMIGEEYEALLQSALEDQAHYYEGEITRLRAELTAENVDERTMTKEEVEEIERLKADVARLRSDIDRVSRQLLDAQAQEAGYRADSQRLLREQSVAKDLLDKIEEEAARENMEGQMKIDELEQQVADLMANLRMRHQFSQDQELSHAQIFGTTGSSKRSSKRGKKLRRLFRK